MKKEEAKCIATSSHIALSRKAAREGAVLLKNERHILPLAHGSRLALLGKASLDYVKGGGGSGDVLSPYVRSIYDGLREHEGEVSLYEPLLDFYRAYLKKQSDAGRPSGTSPEPKVPENLIKSAASYADTALVSFCRTSKEGEDRPKEDFYLSKEERALLSAVKAHFSRIVVLLNIGSAVETAWIKDDPAIGAALLIWQGGMEGGSAAADLLCGVSSPSGKLPDTFARDLSDYPAAATFYESPDYVNYTEDIYVGYRYFLTIPGAFAHIVYPFGYGLSYTSFSVSVKEIYLCAAEKSGQAEENIRLREKEPAADEPNLQRNGHTPQRSTPKLTFRLQENGQNAGYADGQRLIVSAEVKNTGTCPGREVVQLYFSAPQGKMGKPARQLCAFAKTKNLMPGESEELSLSMPLSAMASYDDTGKIQKSAYVLEEGVYCFFLCTSSTQEREADAALKIPADIIVRQLKMRCAPTRLSRRLLADGTYEQLPQQASDQEAAEEPAAREAAEPHAEDPAIEPHAAKAEAAAGSLLPDEDDEADPLPPERGWEVSLDAGRDGERVMFSSVKSGEVTLNEFVDQLSEEECIHLLGGQPNHGLANTFGIGNLLACGVPPVMTSDGPAGVRLTPECGVKTTSFPCAVSLAATWDTDLLCAVGRAAGEEAKACGFSVWLSPAVNIHRHPLCGRNFEYYSEDPYLTGHLAAALVRGVQQSGTAACVKHFACNNKESNRMESDSRVSERALREIYLSSFFLVIREAGPWALMASYNRLNGCRATENADLLTGILREEWHYRGMVMTDWWTHGKHEREVAAGCDLKMARGYPSRIRRALFDGELSSEAVKDAARYVLSLLLHFK